MASIIIIASVFILTLLLTQPSRTIYIRGLWVPVLCIIFIICLVLFSDTAVKAAVYGLNLWAGVIVPSLLPFFTASAMMNAAGFTNVTGALLEPVMRPLFRLPGCSSFALALGVTSGYPVGAKITSDLRKSGSLTKSEAEMLLAFTNNSGPLFIIGAVGSGMYGSSLTGIFLYICHLSACITVGFLFRFFANNRSNTIKVSRKYPGKASKPSGKRKRPTYESKTIKRNLLAEFKKSLIEGNASRPNFGILLSSAVKDSVSTVLSIGGYIVIFSVIISLLNETGIIGAVSDTILKIVPARYSHKEAGGIISGLLSGILEITTGSEQISRCLSIPPVIKLSAASFVIGWAGLSVHFQVMGMVAGTDINIRPYLLGKFLHGLIAAVYAWIGSKICGIERMVAEPALGTGQFNIDGFFQTLGRSLLIMAATIAAWTGVTLMLRSVKTRPAKIKKSSI